MLQSHTRYSAVFSKSGITMKVAVLLVLFCLAEAHSARHSAHSAHYEVHAMLERLKNSMEGRLSLLERQNTDLASRLAASETKIEELQKHKTEMAAKLTASDTQIFKNRIQVLQMKLGNSDYQHQINLLEIKLSSSDKNVEALKKQSEEMAAKLSASEKELEDLQTKLSTTEDQVKVLQTKLSTTEDQVKVLQTKLSTTEDQVKVLQTKLSTTEDQVKVLQTKLSTTEDQVKVLQTKLSTTEDQVQVLQTKLSTTEDQVKVLQTKLSSSDDNVEALKKQSQAHVAQLSTIETHLKTTEDQVQELRNKPEVAFSASLARTFSPSSDSTVDYRNVITNIGKAYNPSTGIFSAPSGGVYHFTFTAAHQQSSSYTDIRMYKNEQRLFYNGEYSYKGYTVSVSNGVILELQKGDRVYMELRGGSKLHDYGKTYNHNMFSGFLLYPM